VELMVDAHGTYTVAEAKRFAHLVEDCDLAWFEEPVIADDKRRHGRVRAATCDPGRHRRIRGTRFDFRDLAVLRAADILQPDPAFCGGITEAMRIAALASPSTCASRRISGPGRPASSPGCTCAASPAASPSSIRCGANPMIHDLSRTRSTARDGMIAIPDGPGLASRYPKVPAGACEKLRPRCPKRTCCRSGRLSVRLVQREGADPVGARTGRAFRVSRGQIREALAILEAMRIVERRAKSGIYLTTRTASVEALALFAKAGCRWTRSRSTRRWSCARSTRSRPPNWPASAPPRRISSGCARSLRIGTRIAAGEAWPGGPRLPSGDRARHAEQRSSTRSAASITRWASAACRSISAIPERVPQSHAEHLQIFEALVRRDGNLAQALMSAHLQGAKATGRA
jgi:hypothetical protein